MKSTGRNQDRNLPDQLQRIQQQVGRAICPRCLLIFGMLYGLALLFLPRGLCGELSAWAALRAQTPPDG